MPPRTKAFLKQAKSKQKKEQMLETADDFQAAGVGFEDAAGKWRAGDAVKSTRFFQRALEVYDKGLERFPTSFDLAYNKARVQLEVATHPVLIKHLSVPILHALRLALDSHRYALALDQDNPDIIFNTSQVLTSIAEEIAKDDNLPDFEAVSILEEALELQNRCLSLQELKLEETSTVQEDAGGGPPQAAEESDDEDGGANLDSANVAQEDQWFSIVEPVTTDTLIDTILAQMGTLTTFCGILSSTPGIAPPATLAWIEEYSTKLLSGKLPSYAKDSQDRIPEIATSKATFMGALLEAGFRSARLDAETYKRELDAAYTALEIAGLVSFEALISRARGLISFNSALADFSPNEHTAYAALRWNALNTAMTVTTKLSSLPDLAPDEKAKSHAIRGDISLLQYRMAQVPTFYRPAIANENQLVKNAEVFYRNASKLSPDEDERAVAGLRSALAASLQTGEKAALMAAAGARGDLWLGSQIEDMIVEGLVPQDLQLS